MRLLVFLLASYGVTNIVTMGRIFQPTRALLARVSPAIGYWVKCPMCFGVAAGVGWAIAGLWPPFAASRFVDLACAGAVSSAFCWIVRVVLHRLGEDQL